MNITKAQNLDKGYINIMLGRYAVILWPYHVLSPIRWKVGH